MPTRPATRADLLTVHAGAHVDLILTKIDAMHAAEEAAEAAERARDADDDDTDERHALVAGRRRRPERARGFAEVRRPHVNHLRMPCAALRVVRCGCDGAAERRRAVPRSSPPSHASPFSHTCHACHARHALALAHAHTHAHTRLLARSVAVLPPPPRQVRLDGDTFFTIRESAAAASIAAGSVVELASRVVMGELRNALAVTRPPGHHCEEVRAPRPGHPAAQ